MTTATRHPVELRYATASDVEARPDTSRVLLALEGSRGTVGLRGRVREPALFRDALAATLGVLASDLRYRGRDRTAYLAYLMKQGKKATAQIWEAQKAFLDQSLADEEQKDTVLDPVLTVDPDRCPWRSSPATRAPTRAWPSTTRSSTGARPRTAPPSWTCRRDLMAKVDRLRTYVPRVAGGPRGAARAARPGRRATWRCPTPGCAASSRCSPPPRCPRARARWRRSISTTSCSRCAPGRRRRRRARCASSWCPAPRRGWCWSRGSWCWSATARRTRGSAPAVVRTFGRQRLAALARLLPHAQRVRVQLLGPGLPGVLGARPGPRRTLTLGLTGWTESGWSSAAAFDVLMPRAVPEGLAEKLRQRLRCGRARSPSRRWWPSAGAPEGRGARGAAARVPARPHPLRRGQGRLPPARAVRPRRWTRPPSATATSARRGPTACSATAAGRGEVKSPRCTRWRARAPRSTARWWTARPCAASSPRFTLDMEGRVREADLRLPARSAAPACARAPAST